MKAIAKSDGVSATQSTNMQEKFIGTWLLVSLVAHQRGKTTEPLGARPLGSAMFDRNGRFMAMIARRDLPRFAGNRHEDGTPEESQAVMAGSLAYFGTYSINEAEQLLTLHAEASTFPNWIGGDQKRKFKFEGDHLKLTAGSASNGGEVFELVWKRP